MTYLDADLIPLLWCGFLLYWKIAALNVKTTARRESMGSYLRHGFPLIAGILLLAWPELGQNPLFGTLWHRSPFLYWSGVALLLLGFAFCIWARRVLGRNWSQTVTLKENHELIQSGPYQWVRHPIYTGLLLAFLGSALALSEWRGVLALVLILAAFLIKLKIEERWMIELFGESYRQYQHRVSMLVPFIW